MFTARYGLDVSMNFRLIFAFSDRAMARVVSRSSFRRPEFDPRSVSVRFVVDKLALGRLFFSPSTSVLPCHYYYSTSAPY